MAVCRKKTEQKTAMNKHKTIASEKEILLNVKKKCRYVRREHYNDAYNR